MLGFLVFPKVSYDPGTDQALPCLASEIWWDRPQGGTATLKPVQNQMRGYSAYLKLFGKDTFELLFTHCMLENQVKWRETVMILVITVAMSKKYFEELLLSIVSTELLLHYKSF